MSTTLVLSVTTCTSTLEAYARELRRSLVATEAQVARVDACIPETSQSFRNQWCELYTVRNNNSASLISLV